MVVNWRSDWFVFIFCNLKQTNISIQYCSSFVTVRFLVSVSLSLCLFKYCFKQCYRNLFLQIIYMSCVCVLGILCIVISQWEKFSTAKYRGVRAGMHLQWVKQLCPWYDVSSCVVAAILVNNVVHYNKNVVLRFSNSILKACPLCYGINKNKCWPDEHSCNF